MDLGARAQNIIDEFSRYSDWEDRYKHMIEMAKGLPEFPASLQIEKYKVKGCQSQVWLVPSLVEGKVEFQASSDAVLVRGIVALLIKVYSQSTPDEIIQFEPDYLKEIGITQHLSMNRTNGLASMIKQIKMYAIAYKTLVDQGITNAHN